VAVGLLVGVVVIRLDLVLTGSRRGRRARTDDSGSTLRPEPRRTQPLL
jgi:hypothetical protein